MPRLKSPLLTPIPSNEEAVLLNLCLIQTLPFVRDDLILHELMHLREMNRPAWFWREVERVCPAYTEAKRRLKPYSDLLR